MSTIDVSAEIDIEAAPTGVAGVMFDPQRELEWVKAVTGVELIDASLKPGARVKRTGQFLGHDFAWTTEVESVHFPHVLVLKVVDGPFVGTVRYDIQRSGTGSRVRIRNVGEAPKLSFLPAALVTGPIRSAMTADLDRLKAIVEAKTP
ncbi:MAG: SRPBCC family protein [Acidobacteriota bacterium]